MTGLWIAFADGGSIVGMMEDSVDFADNMTRSIASGAILGATVPIFYGEVCDVTNGRLKASARFVLPNGRFAATPIELSLDWN